MKKCYFGLLLLLTISVNGQEVTTVNTPLATEKSSFMLYPNPAINDVVYITTPRNDVKEVVVYDVFGKIVLMDRITSKTLNITRLVAGVYVLQVTEKNKTMTRKLVVK